MPWFSLFVVLLFLAPLSRFSSLILTYLCMPKSYLLLLRIQNKCHSLQEAFWIAPSCSDLSTIDIHILFLEPTTFNLVLISSLYNLR